LFLFFEWRNWRKRYYIPFLVRKVRKKDEKELFGGLCKSDTENYIEEYEDDLGEELGYFAVQTLRNRIRFRLKGEVVTFVDKFLWIKYKTRRYLRFTLYGVFAFFYLLSRIPSVYRRSRRRVRYIKYQLRNWTFKKYFFLEFIVWCIYFSYRVNFVFFNFFFFL